MEVIVPEWLRDAKANDNFVPFGETIYEHGCEMLTHYEVLEISESASAEVIRAAHRSLIAKYHPDRDQSPEGRDRFLQVQKAFDVLSDEVRRQEYDRSLGSHGPQQPNTAAIVMRVDGTSSFLTLSEHLKRSGSELANCDLSGIDLRGVSLRAANLSGAKLDGAAFAGCDFSNANLTNCSATDCDFDGVQFGGANLTGANFRGSSMIKATFYRVGAIMGSTEKSQSYRFSHFDIKSRVVDDSGETKATTLDTVNFSHCDLRGAVFVAPPPAEKTTSTQSVTLGVERPVPFFLRQTFTSCTFRNCNFSKSNLHQVDLHGLNLRGDNFSGANLHGANLIGSNIDGLDLSECNLVNADLHKVCYDGETKLPSGYPLPTDARDMDAERATDARDMDAELSKAKRQAEIDGRVTTVLVVVVSVLFLLFICLVAFSPDRAKVGSLPTPAAQPKSETQRTSDPQTKQQPVVTVVAQPAQTVRLKSYKNGQPAGVLSDEPKKTPVAESRAVRNQSVPTQPLWSSFWRAAMQAANAGDFDRAIDLAHRARAVSDFDERVALAKLIRQWDRERTEFRNSKRETASKK